MASAPPQAANVSGDFARRLVAVVDHVPETRGIGVVLIDFGQLRRLRNPDPGEATVVFERRPKLRPSPLLPATPPPSSVRTATTQRNAGTSPATEWMNLGLNCGGAVLAWIGVAGMSSLAPVTGGVSAAGAIMMYGGAIAASGQCMVSVVRTANVHRGRADINRRLDDSKVYYWTMLAADGVGLVGAGGALRELKATNASLRSAGYSFGRASAGGTISRPMRQRLTTMLDLRGGARVPAIEINRVVRQKLLDGAAGALGMFASGYSGILNEVGGGGWDLIVWITEETGKRQ